MRIGEETLLHVLQQCSKNVLPSTPSSCTVPLSSPCRTHPAVRPSVRQCFARRRGRLSGAAVFDPAPRARAIQLPAAFAAIAALLLDAFAKRRARTAFLAPIRPGELTIDEDDAPGILAAERLRIGWNDAIRDRADT